MSRRCLICAHINPCKDHSEEAQDADLRRNTSVADDLIAQRKATPPQPSAAESETQ